MAKIFLNEGTILEVTESKGAIHKLVSEKIKLEKLPYKGDNLHFIEVSLERLLKDGQPDKFVEPVKTDLYFKRILFIYN